MQDHCRSLYGFQTSHVICVHLAANFRCHQFRIIPEIVSKLLSAAVWSRCVFDSNLSRHPFLGQVVDLDLLLSMLCAGFDSEHADLFLCYIFTQRSMNDRRLSEAKTPGVLRWVHRRRLWSATTFRQFHRKVQSHEYKKWLVTARNLQSIKTFLTVERSQYRKSGSTFSSCEPVTARSDYRRPGNTLLFCWPVRPAQAVPERWLKSSAIDFAVKTFHSLFHSLFE